MKIFRIALILILFFISHFRLYSQDIIRIGAAHDFQKDKVVQTFSLDLNRTEKIDEKTGRFIIFSTNNFYILPTTDINVGDGVTSSENNILFQINMGKAFYGEKWKSKDNLSTSVWNKAIEFNPSYNSDKLFAEKLYYGQIKLLLNFLRQSFNARTDDGYIKTIHCLGMGVFSNIGYRNSNTYSANDLYSTLGFLIDYKTRLLNSKKKESWLFKISGDYYYIVSDVNELTSSKFGGIVKCSVDKLLFNSIYCGISYKYGNDNPNYKYVHTIDLSAKIKY
jgi:hypothetical protein